MKFYNKKFREQIKEFLKQVYIINYEIENRNGFDTCWLDSHTTIETLVEQNIIIRASIIPKKRNKNM